LCAWIESLDDFHHRFKLLFFEVHQYDIDAKRALDDLVLWFENVAECLLDFLVDICRFFEIAGDIDRWCFWVVRLP